MPDLLIYYIDNFTIACDLNYRTKPNFAFGHLISYLLEAMYSLTFTLYPDHILSPLIDKCFHIFYKLKNHPSKSVSKEEEDVPLPNGGDFFTFIILFCTTRTIKAQDG